MLYLRQAYYFLKVKSDGSLEILCFIAHRKIMHIIKITFNIWEKYQANTVQCVHAVSVRKKAKHTICVQHNSCTVYNIYFIPKLWSDHLVINVAKLNHSNSKEVF
jgi:hypothetical protein